MKKNWKDYKQHWLLHEAYDKLVNAFDLLVENKNGVDDLNKIVEQYTVPSTLGTCFLHLNRKGKQNNISSSSIYN